MSFVVIHDLLGWIGDKKREDWIVVEGMHEAIIDRDTYDIVQEKVKSWKRPDAWDNFSLFAGLVKCGQCGSTLNIRWANQKGNERIYTCSRYNKYGGAHCTSTTSSMIHSMLFTLSSLWLTLRNNSLFITAAPTTYR